MFMRYTDLGVGHQSMRSSEPCSGYEFPDEEEAEDEVEGLGAAGNEGEGLTNHEEDSLLLSSASEDSDDE